MQSFYQSTQSLYINPEDAPQMTEATETTTCLKITINRQDLTTKRTETVYTFLMGWLIKKGKTCSPVGWVGILTMPLEWTLIQCAHAGLPAGPFQTPPTSADAPIYPAAATHYQITTAEQDLTTSKNIWKEFCDAKEGGKETRIEACDDDILDKLWDPLLGFGSVTLREMVTFIFGEYSVFNKVTQIQLREMMTEPWTGGRIRPVFARINRAATTYAQHNAILREDEKVNIVVEVIEDSGLLAAKCSEWRNRDEANKTWTSVQAHFKKAAKDLKFQQSMCSGGFANAAQQTANLATEAINQQTGHCCIRLFRRCRRCYRVWLELPIRPLVSHSLCITHFSVGRGCWLNQWRPFVDW